MVKKTYIAPEALAIQFVASQIIAVSFKINRVSGELDETNSITAQDQILTKENKSLWDEEW